MKAAALIPAYNEDRTIAKVILGCEDFCEEVVVCDDGSDDSTSKITDGLGVMLLRHETNEGKGEALRSLFLKACELDFEAFVTIDADGQHDPADIPKLLAALEDADMVIGGRSSIPMIRSIGNLVLSGFGEFDTQSGFRAYRREALARLVPSIRGMGVDSEIFQGAKDLNMRIAQVEVKTVYDVPKPSKLNIAAHFSEVTLDKILLFLVKHPVVFLGIPGLAVIIIGLSFALADFSTLVTQGLGSVLLIDAGEFSLQTAIIIWVVLTITRRRRD